MTTKDVILTITLMLAAGLGAELVAELLRVPPMLLLLATGALLEQTIPGRGADLTDPAVAAEAASRMARLRSEVGL